jgi:predicted CXXCH cytochrome family protein
MKLKRLVLLSSLILGLTPFSWGQIAGSSHDFTTSGNTSINTTGELCIVCHAPHGTDPNYAPLWNHTTTTSIFTTYSGYKFSKVGLGGNGVPAPQPDGPSKMCLSCHDGQTAVNQFGGKYQGTTGAAVYFNHGNTMFTPSGTGTSLGGTTNTNGGLNGTHPISFVYNQTLVANDGALNDPTTQPSGMGGTIQTDFLDANNKVQCSSCHEPHDPTISKFLRVSNVGSALCLTCHKK